MPSFVVVWVVVGVAVVGMSGMLLLLLVLSGHIAVAAVGTAVSVVVTVTSNIAAVNTITTHIEYTTNANCPQRIIP